jgi:hypothetical protein
MSANAFIDIAIGLVLMYLVLSLLCTVINEYIASFMALRAKALQAGLQKLLDVPALKAAFDNHGLIASVKDAKSGSEPSYLPGRTFAMALFGSLDPAKPLPLLSDIEISINKLPDSNIRDMLLAQLTTAGGDLTKLRDGVAMWFDDAMDRLGGLYKRNLKLISLLVGLLLATGLNADTFAVGKALWSDSELRASMVQAAQPFISKPLPPTAGSNANPDPYKSFNDTMTTLRPLPIGWDFKASFAYGDPGLLILKLFGLLFTGLALTLGAPFWFDLLSKFMRIRGTGTKPERTEDLKQKGA